MGQFLQIISLLAAIAILCCSVFGSETHESLVQTAETAEKRLAGASSENKCSYRNPGDAEKTLYARRLGNERRIMLQSPCFRSMDSLGNFLSSYFESILCAKYIGAHFATLHFYDPNDAGESPLRSWGRNARGNRFLSALPRTILNNISRTSDTGTTSSAWGQRRLRLPSVCPCKKLCHEWIGSLMYQNGSMSYLGSLFRKAMDTWLLDAISSQNVIALPNSGGSHLRSQIDSGEFKLVLEDEDLKKGTTAATFFSPSGADPASLPFIPDVAIHYRCGDNVYEHYGFTMFQLFKTTIPPDAKNIYVMGESSQRKASTDSSFRCSAIFQALFKYLREHFPTANVVMMRGQSVLSDMARLTYARTVVCSVSTFCLWPAVSSGGPRHSSTAGTKAYYPRTNLLAKSRSRRGNPSDRSRGIKVATNIMAVGIGKGKDNIGGEEVTLPSMDADNDSGFRWTPPMYLDGRVAKVMTVPRLVKMLSSADSERERG